MKIATLLSLMPLLYPWQQACQFKSKQNIAPATIFSRTDRADILYQGISNNYTGFKKVFPDANDHYRPPGVSFMNKNKKPAGICPAIIVSDIGFLL
jgi:hypothetical protein